MIHWSWFLFAGVIALFVFFAWRISVHANNNKGDDYGFDVETLFYDVVWLAALIIFIVLFGGIFWW
jgi:heme/copper-type cytochrome/quinol oxidase subunit 2